MKLSYLITSIFSICSGYKLAVVGAGGNLGREIVVQAIRERRMSVLGLSSVTDVFFEPSRVNSFSNANDTPQKFESSMLTLHNYWSYINEDYEHLVFCTSAKPLQYDYSGELMEKIMQSLSPQCKSISLVSAFGVGESIKRGNIGIKIMNSFYLKDVYRSKNDQEDIINSINDTKLRSFIYRPRALSFGETTLRSYPRKDFAKLILNNIERVDIDLVIKSCY